MDFDKMPITLTDSQRNLLLEYESYFADQSLFRRISIALKRGKEYEILLDENELVDMVIEVSNFSEHEEDLKIRNKLYHLSDCLAEYYNDMQEENDNEDDDDLEGDDDCSEYSSNTGSVCILKVSLLNSEIWRKIAIREGHTLDDLNDIIFDAFDRYDDHMYSFYFPHSRKMFNPRTIRKHSDEYTHPYACEEAGIYGEGPQNASLTSIGDLSLSKRQKFYYLFDFGDMWWHEITVEKTDGVADTEKYPRIIERKGESPEQYDYPEDE